MFAKRVLAVVVGCGFLGGVLSTQALAQPGVSVVGTPNGDNIDWTVAFEADPSYFSNTTVGFGGSMAVELTLEIFGEIISEPIVHGVDWDHLNPGSNPHAGTVTYGVHRYDEVDSTVVVGPTQVDAIYLALGSRVFHDDAPNLAVTFTTAGSSSELYWGGYLAQQGYYGDFIVGSQVVDTPVGLLLGDADNDGFVKGGDLLAVTNNFGSIGPADGLLLGDADDDGLVKGGDLLAVTNNFGAVLANLSFAQANGVTASTVAVSFGDADNDGYIKGSDLLAVTNNFGNTGPADGLLLGDADEDGAVTGADLLAVINNFGQSIFAAGAAGVVGVPGDYDFDGEVKLYDYPVWRDTRFQGSDLRADGDFDGFISENDYNIWTQNYGSFAGLTAEGETAVPEPSAMLLLLVATVLAITLLSPATKGKQSGS